MLSRARRLLLLLLLLLYAAAAPLHAQRDEQQVKAAYVLNFLRFTDWPTPPPPGEPLVLAVVGDREFVATLREIAREGEKLGQRGVSVRRIERDATPERLARAMREAHAVYVQADAGDAAAAVLAATAGKPLLTIGDAPGFAAAGGMLGLVPAGPRIVFDANPHAIQASGLKVSAKVMKLAQLVEPPP